MNIIEALQAMKEGKKVQYKGGEIFKYENKHIININGDYTALIYNNLEDDNWSVYQEKPILTDSEKEYLEYVLRPFKDDVALIKKSKSIIDERIFITMESNNYLYFPTSKKELRYAGMKDNYEYTPEELGLWED